MNKIMKISAVLILNLLIASCDKKPVEPTKPPPKPIYYEQLDEDYEEEEAPAEGDLYIDPTTVTLDEYDIHTELQSAYLESSYNQIKKFGSGTKELSKARTFKLIAGEEEEEVEGFYIQLSEQENFSDYVLYEVDANYVEVSNLKVDTTYYYRGHQQLNQIRNSEVYSFTTSDVKLRNCNIDGVANVRDIGGYPSKLGGRVRQGLYYRGGRLNASNTNKLKVEATEKGLEELLDELRINTEIDLRMNEDHYSGTAKNEFGYINNDTFPDIEYMGFPLDWNYANMMISEKETIGKIFKELAKEENYPIYLHCNIGTDRTGMCSYLLGTLLGISQVDLYHDYLFSNLSVINGSRDISTVKDVYYKTLLSYEQDNLYYDVREYLKEAGLSDEELDNIVDIFLDLRIYD